MSAPTITRGGSLGSDIPRDEAYRWLYANLIDVLDAANWITNEESRDRINALAIECMQLARGLESDDATCSYATLMEEQRKKQEAANAEE